MDSGTRAPSGSFREPQIEGGIDWVTWIDRSDHGAETAEAIAHAMVREHEPLGTKVRPFNLHGYEGWGTAHFRYGRRGHSGMIQCSGTGAAYAWTMLPSSTGRVTRLDVQITHYLSRSQPLYGMRFLRCSPRAARSSPSRSPRSGLSKDSTGLFLGTVGARTNSRYLRVYDKGVETRLHPPGHLWRTELEAKGTFAQRLWQDLQKAPDKAVWCLRSVAQQWSRSGRCWPLTSLVPTEGGIAVPKDPPSEIERTARWMRQTVVPVVERLCAAYGRDSVLRMLGLEQPPNDADA